jgi:PAS domain S-box-containing protein
MSISGIAEPRSVFVKRLVMIVFVANFLFIGLAVFLLQQAWQQYEERAEIATQNLSYVLAENISDSIDKIDLTLLMVADEVEKQFAGGGINAHRLNAFIVRHHARLPFMDGLRMVNAQGENAYGIAITPGSRSSIVDRAFFVRLRSDPNAGLFISEPVVGRVSKKWQIVLARRVNQPDGSFGGAVYGTITLAQFLKTFSAIDVGKHGVVVLRDEELALIARYPESQGDSNLVGKKDAPPELQNAVLVRKDAGSYYIAHSFDNVKRTSSYRKVSNRPLYVIVGLAYEDYHGAWWSEFVWVSALATLFILGTLISSWMVYRGWMRRTKAVQALAQKEKALMESEEKHRNLIEHSYYIIYTLSADGVFTFVSPAWTEILGHPVTEVVGKPFQQFVHPDDLAGCMVFLHSVIETGQRQDGIEYRMRHIDGSWRWHTSSAVPLRDEAGRVIGFEGTARDITERKQAEEERAKLEAQLLQAQKMEAVGQLAGGVAHDFNNILAAISGFGFLLNLQLKGNDKGTQYVSQILQAAERAATLTQSLLAFSRKQHINPQPIDLNATIRMTEIILARTIGEDIRLSLQLTEENTSVLADSNQIAQILINLATNARDSMPKGGALTIGTARSFIDEAFMKMHGYGSSGDYVVMIVTDSGMGMDEATRKRVFEPFFTTKEVGKGTGLGLSMVYGIVKQHNGFIDVYSEIGTGTAFKVYLPALEMRAEVQELNGNFEPESATETILVVEDDSVVRRALTEMLQSVGHTIIEACDGDEAVTKFLEHKDEIHLVLMDVIMPRKSGGDAYQELKAIQPAVKIILMSGYAGDYLTGKLSMEDDVHFIEKPVSPKELFEKIRSVLSNGTA